MLTTPDNLLFLHLLDDDTIFSSTPLDKISSFLSILSEKHWAFMQTKCKIHQNILIF